ncbi:MAG TPA: polymer-forming cytoskeletal protein [Candidatus Acidoferrum sp.]|nr:polymer-forming cytoskeletal protein [Candidatus Acidoferrum sp.]
MWNEKKPETKSAEAPRPVDAAAERTTGWLGASLRVKGEISGTEDLLIDGVVEGQIQLDDHKLTVGKTAKLTADINARDVVVYGYVKGNVRAKGRIEIKKDGYVIGNLTTAQIMIEDGADFKGTIEIDRGAPREADKNVPARAAAAAAGAGAGATPAAPGATPKST